MIAAGCSELALIGFYGLLHLSPGLSSALAWLAGAVPNYWLNRSWAWRLRGRPSVRREVLPYVAVVAVTLLLAVGSTHLVDGWLRDAQSDPDVRVAAVAATFLGVYVLMFALRFLLLDRLFSSPITADGPDE